MNLIKLAENSFAVEYKGQIYYGTFREAFSFLKKNLVPASEFIIAMEEMLKNNHNMAHFGTYGNRGFIFSKEIDTMDYLPVRGVA